MYRMTYAGVTIEATDAAAVADLLHALNTPEPARTVAAAPKAKTVKAHTTPKKPKKVRKSREGKLVMQERRDRVVAALQAHGPMKLAALRDLGVTYHTISSDLNRWAAAGFVRRTGEDWAAPIGSDTAPSPVN